MKKILGVSIFNEYNNLGTLDITNKLQCLGAMKPDKARREI
jgi:hypothetical protein